MNVPNIVILAVVAIIACGFIGFAIGALLPVANGASTGTGIGSAVGVVVSFAYWLVTRK